MVYASIDNETLISEKEYMPRKKRSIHPRNREEKVLMKVCGELRPAVSKHSRSMLTVREMDFARLVVEENYSKADAYIASFDPETKNVDSIYVMSCRLAGTPRVKAEIERLKRRIQDHIDNQLDKDSLNRLISDPEQLRMRMMKDLYMIASNEEIDVQYRVKAWETIGKTKQVGAFATSSFSVDKSKNSVTNNTQVNNVGVASSDLSQERLDIMRQIGQMVGSQPLLGSPQTIDTKVDSKDKVIDV